MPRGATGNVRAGLERAHVVGIHRPSGAGQGDPASRGGNNGGPLGQIVNGDRAVGAHGNAIDVGTERRAQLLLDPPPLRDIAIMLGQRFCKCMPACSGPSPQIEIEISPMPITS